MEPQKKMMKTSCLGYFENPVIVELVSGSFGDDEQSLRIFKTFLAGETPEDPENPMPFAKRYPFMKRLADPPLAALKGRFSVVKWLVPLVDVIKCEYLGHEGHQDHLDILRWLGENGCSLNGHLDEDKEVCMRMCEKAAEGGHLEILQWLHGVGCPWDIRTLHAAASNGHLDCLKWADKNCRFRWGWNVCKSAALAGHLECLKWTMGSECSPRRSPKFLLPSDVASICWSAAAGGSLMCLQWARENGCSWNHITCSYAAEGGHLAVLKWARENGCPWDEDTCTYAARNGHMECLKWARENGCPWNEETCAYAAENGQLECLKWARDNGCPEN